MTTRSRWTLFLVLLVALALAAAPASAAPLGGDAALICAQTPSAAAADAANSQITPDDPNVGTAACGALCQKWVGTCKGAVAAMKACWLKAVGKVAGLRNATCATLDGPAEDGCRDAVMSERDAAKDFILNDAEIGRGICEGAGLAACITNCS